MAKKLAVQERNIKESSLAISKQINVNFRNYAIYVLENRGIPSYYDGLTNVQRVALMNAPKTFSKTISLVGACISNGYHHGDKSLSGAINKLARPFGCSEQLLMGDGFFGTPVNPDASASRYTSVKINSIVNELISKYMVLNRKNDDDQWEWLRTDVPVGLLTSTIGIAVGYSTTIMPRKLEEIQKFLDGKKATMAPYFKNFSGRVTNYNGGKKSWLIEGVCEIDEAKKTIRILELPPLMKYSSFIKKLSKFADSDYDFGVQNDSSDNIDVTLKYKSGHSWETFKERVEKMVKILATETLIYVKDSVVVEYEGIADYLTEFRVHREYVRLQKSIHDLRVYNEELEFLKAKLEYLNFMLAKKRANAEIDIFLGVYTSRIKSRLERTLLRDLSQETLVKTQELIDEMIKTIAEENKTMQLLEASHLKLKEETPVLNKSTHNKSVDLFLEDATEIDGIEIFNGEETDTDDQEDDSENE